MAPVTNQNDGRLGSLLLRLQGDGSTGILSVTEGEKHLKLYLMKGRLVYADGVDKEGPLLVELMSKGRIDLRQLDELRVLKEEDAQGLGKALLDRKVISESLWRGFLLLKVKDLSSAAFSMENPDLVFSESELSILPVNFIRQESLPLLLDTIRSTTPRNPLREILKSKDAVFGLSTEAPSCIAHLPLNPSEEKTLSLIDGRKTAKEILKSSGLTSRLFQKSLYLFLRLGLVDTVPQQPQISREHSDIIRLYLNLLLIAEANYREEIGKGFHKVFKKCVMDMPLPGKALFYDIDWVNENLESAAKKIGAHFMEKKTLSDGRLVLLTSFSKLLYLLNMRMNKLLGKKRAEKTIEEMIHALLHLDLGKKNPETTLYATRNLEDFLRQMRS